MTLKTLSQGSRSRRASYVLLAILVLSAVVPATLYQAPEVEATLTEVGTITIQNSGTTDISSAFKVEISDITFFNTVNPTTLKITDETGNLVPFWIQEWDTSTYKAVIWVNATVPASSSITLNVYCDSSLTQSLSDGSSVFSFFTDDFSDWNYYDKEGDETVQLGDVLYMKVSTNTAGADLTAWTTFNHLENEVILTKMKIYMDGTSVSAGLALWDSRGDYDPGNGGECWLISGGIDDKLFGVAEWSGFPANIIFSFPPDFTDYHEWKIEKLGDTYKFYYDGEYKGEYINSSFNLANEIGFTITYSIGELSFG